MNTLQRACSVKCAIALVRDDEKRKQRRENAQARAKLETRRDLLKKAQVIANRYARVRDRYDGCISCDKPASWHGQWHGSHYRPAGSNPSVRLNLWNIHKACSVCNNYLSGNLVAYRARLVKKIGTNRLEWLEQQTHAPKMDAEYLARYCRVIGKRLRRMERRIDD